MLLTRQLSNLSFSYHGCLKGAGGAVNSNSGAGVLIMFTTYLNDVLFDLLSNFFFLLDFYGFFDLLLFLNFYGFLYVGLPFHVDRVLHVNRFLSFRVLLDLDQFCVGQLLVGHHVRVLLNVFNFLSNFTYLHRSCAVLSDLFTGGFFLH